MRKLSPAQARRLRLHAQRLHPRVPRQALLDAVRAVVGVQAQSQPAMMLALRARVAGVTVADVKEAVGESRGLVRTWLLRGTLHLVMAEDVRWLVPALGPTFIASDKRRRQELGLDEELAARGVGAIRTALSQGSALTRQDLVAELKARGVALEPRSQAPIHLIQLAALQGVLCYGRDTEKGEETFVLLEKWAGPLTTLPEGAGLSELARRYVRGYGPASLGDLAGWSGLGMAAARKGWEALGGDSEFAEARVGGLAVRVSAAALETLPEQDNADPLVLGSAGAALLPAFDTYTLGYAQRDLLVRPEHRARVYHGGQTVPVVLLDGEAAGVWRYERHGKRLAVIVQAFDQFEPEVRRAIAEEADDIGRFWEMTVSLHIEQGDGA